MTFTRQITFLIFTTLLTALPGMARRHPPVAFPSQFAVYYGNWSEALIRNVIGATGQRAYDLLIVHPKTNLTRAHVAALQRAGTRVIGYLSVGEDSALHPGAGWYYDADRDGRPDRNAQWNSWFANVADPQWRRALKTYTNTGDQQWYGYDYLLRTLGCDGLFLDTIDTVRPAAWSGKYAAQLPAMLALLAAIRADISNDRLLFINRGLFYFAPYDTLHSPDGLAEITPTMRDRLRGLIDGLLIEEWQQEPQRDRWAARLKAEAVKPDGFSIITLDYLPVQPDAACAEARRHGWTAYVSTPALDRLTPTRCNP